MKIKMAIWVLRSEIKEESRKRLKRQKKLSFPRPNLYMHQNIMTR